MPQMKLNVREFRKKFEKRKKKLVLPKKPARRPKKKPLELQKKNDLLKLLLYLG